MHADKKQGTRPILAGFALAVQTLSACIRVHLRLKFLAC
jgi:hypothetical protein